MEVVLDDVEVLLPVVGGGVPEQEVAHRVIIKCKYSN